MASRYSPSSCLLQLLLFLLHISSIVPASQAHPHVHGATVPAMASARIASASSTSTTPEHAHIDLSNNFDQQQNVLVFQTSRDPLVPCFFTRIITPPDAHRPPCRLVIASPASQSGTYPVILFKHGFNLANCAYTQLFEFLASSGYIVVAPQALDFSTDATREIEETAKVANWILAHLAAVLSAALPRPVEVVPDMSKLVMAGHSRGGKVAFAMLLGKPSVEIPSFSALVTLDPVDCLDANIFIYPPIVEAGCDHNRNLMSLPVLIVGTGYGSRSITPITPACAPASCNHEAYFNCSSAPIIYHFVALNYGHLDFLDDGQIWTGLVCVSGSSKAPLRNYAGELMVAFLESALKGKQEGMERMVTNWQSAPIALEKPQIYKGVSAAAADHHIHNIMSTSVIFDV